MPMFYDKRRCRPQSKERTMWNIAKLRLLLQIN